MADEDQGGKTWQKKIFVPVLLLLLTVFFLQAFVAMLDESDTFDESMAVTAGYLKIIRDDWRFAQDRPTLLGLITAPLLVASGQKLPTPPADLTNIHSPVVGFNFYYRYGNDHRQIIFLSRLPVLILATLLGLFVGLWAREVFGKIPALFVLALFAFSPNLLAFARIATDDITCTAMMFIATFTFRSFLQQPSRGRIFAAGVCLGVALLSKYTALMLIPVFIALVVMHLLLTPVSEGGGSLREGVGSWMMRVASILAIAMIVVWAGYGFSSDISWYVRGLQKIYYVEEVHTSRYYFYLFGQPLPHAVWYYYLVTYILKTPAAMLILIAFSLLLSVRIKGVAMREALLLILPAGAVLAASTLDQANLGFRRILPAVPFLIVFSGMGIRFLLRLGIPGFATVALLVSGYIIFSLQVWPYHLAYFNKFVGGPAKGLYYLDDSNVDWGQNLPRLKAYLNRQECQGPIYLAYFGNADPRAWGIDYKTWDMSDLDHIRQPIPGTVVMSAHRLARLRLYAVLLGDHQLDWLSRFTPVGRVGHSYLIYNFP